MTQGWSQFGPETLVNTQPNGAQNEQAVSGLATGGYVVTWSSRNTDGSGKAVVGRMFAADGTPLGDEFQINTYTNDSQKTPSVVGLPDGGFVVTWVSVGQDGDDSGIFAQRFDSDGAPVGTEFLVNTTTNGVQVNPSVISFSDGGFLVTWDSRVTRQDRFDIKGQRYDVDGTPIGSEFLINTETRESQSNQSAAGLLDGGFVVTWYDFGKIEGQLYDINGTPIGTEFRINTDTRYSAYSPDITALDDGGFVVTWTSREMDGHWYGIAGQRFDADGIPVGPEFGINTWTANAQEASSVAALADGGFVVTWQSAGQDGDGYGIYGQRYDAAGAVVGEEVQINFHTQDNQSGAEVSVLDDGSFVVSWTSQNQDGTSESIYSRHFAAELWGTAGRDKITDWGDANWINGQAGNDTLRGRAGEDLIRGGDGDDVILGGAQGDTLYGNLGNDNIVGGAGADLLYGNLGTDTLSGGQGPDTLFGGAGDDWLDGDDGRDHLDGGTGNDQLFGGADDDDLIGNQGNDDLFGQGGRDDLFGNAGEDLLDGGAGDDTMNGGAAADTFVFGAGADRVMDFEDDLDTLLFDATLWGGGAKSVADILTYAAVDGDDLVFDFGSGNTLTLIDYTDSASLVNDIGWV